MTELLSRILLSTEAIVITFPLTAYFVTEKLPAQWQRAAETPGPETWLALAACAVLLAYAACLWRLTVAFSVDGSAALRSLFVRFWYAPHVAAALAACVLVSASAAFVVEPSWIREFAWALPMAIPSAHLGLECMLRSDAFGGVAAGDGGRSRPGVPLKLVR